MPNTTMNVIFDEKKEKKKKVPMNNASPGAAKTIYNFYVRDVEGAPVPMEKYRNKVCLFVNISITNFGFTYHNFIILRNLHKKFSNDVLRILMFPCNQFDNRETKISTRRYIEYINNFGGMDVDLLGRVNVNCDKESPLWKYLKLSVDIGEKRFIKNPYEKFIVNKQGVPIARLGPQATEEEVEEAIHRCLQEKKKKY